MKKLVDYYKKVSDGLCCQLTTACPKFDTPLTVGLSYKDEWEIEHSTVSLKKKLGEGQFAKVWAGVWNGTLLIAVKIPEPCTMDTLAFVTEAQIMKNIIHKHLVHLYAVCSKAEPFYIITELMRNGSLLHYLQKGEEHHLKMPQLLNIAAQVASGMAYLEKNDYVHGNLAARNVLVGDAKIIKIADFGLYRVIINEEWRRKLLTNKWTAPEAAFCNHFSIKSDTWSFGIFLSELITHGSIPYPGMTDGEVLAKVEQGYRMPPPPTCPKPLYKLMLNCWKKEF